MKKLLMLAAFAALAAGCSVTKINYEKDDKGVVSYRIYHNDHWLKTDATMLKGGMTQDGTFEISADGLKTSPSEEFNKTMKTYTAAVVDIAQLTAAAYNPSSSGVAAAKTTESAPTVVNVQPAVASTTNAASSATTTNTVETTTTTNAVSTTDCAEAK